MKKGALNVESVWLQGAGEIGYLVNSGKGKINSKPDVKWNLSLRHIRCN